MSRSRWCASASCSAVTPKNPLWTSMNVAMRQTSFVVLCPHLSGRDPRLAGQRRNVIGQTTDAVRRGRPTLQVMDAARSFISPLLVGRDDLLELAARRLDEAAEGRGQLLLIAGEA